MRKQRRTGHRAMILLLALLTAGIMFAAIPGATAASDTGGTYVSDPVTPIAVDVGPGFTTPAPEFSGEVPEGGLLSPGTPPAPRQLPDPVIQLSAIPDNATRTGAISGPVANFAGITSGSNPPDTVGDIGPNHYVQMVNATQYQVWDKFGTTLAGPATFGNLWPVADICRGNVGDPIVVYDHLADRWLLSQFGWSGFLTAPFAMCIAISQTPDPSAGTWYVYSFSPLDSPDQFPDYPKFGVWPDGYYMTSNEGSNLGIFVFDRANMLNGAAALFMKTTLANPPASSGFRNTRVLPADLDGPPPLLGTPNYMVRTVDDNQDTGNPTDRVEVYTAAANWAGPSFTFSLVDTISPTAFDIMACNRSGTLTGVPALRDCIPQPDSDDSVDALSNRPMMQLKYRNFGTHEAMVVNQTIDISGSINGLLGFTPANEVAGVRWYELRRTGAAWSINQEGTYAPQPLGATTEPELMHRWMGSAAMDSAGNIALGYSATNSDSTNGNEIYPGLYYTGRLSTDGAGLLPQGEDVLLAGTGPQGNNAPPISPQRWGDYSALSVDPADDCTFWFTGHNANGVTRIGSFRFNTCVVPVAFCDGLQATIVGTANDDTISGTPGDDVIAGLGGADTISGLGGHDRLCGGDGNDRLLGGDGDDRMFGQGGADEMRGHGGNDFMKGGAGNDTAWGADGDDEIIGHGGSDSLRGGRGADTLLGNSGNDYLQGDPDFDILRGGSGTDTCRSGEDNGSCEL